MTGSWAWRVSALNLVVGNLAEVPFLSTILQGTKCSPWFPNKTKVSMFDSDIMGKPTLTILCTEHFQEFLSLDVESVWR